MSSGLASLVTEPQLELAISGSSAAARSHSGDAELGERRLRRMLQRKQQQGDLAGMAACYIKLGDLLLSQGDSEEAGEHYRQALSLSRQAHERRQALARL